jgi:hypothetical protein
MSDSRTVLPASKVLNLISVSAEAQVITLTAQTSSPKALALPYAESYPDESTRATQELSLICPGRESQLHCRCVYEDSSATREPANGQYSQNRCPALLHVMLAEPSGCRVG